MPSPQKHSSYLFQRAIQCQMWTCPCYWRGTSALQSNSHWLTRLLSRQIHTPVASGIWTVSPDTCFFRSTVPFIPSTHMPLTTVCNSSPKGSYTFFCLLGYQACMCYIDIHGNKTPIHINKMNIKLSSSPTPHPGSFWINHITGFYSLWLQASSLCL